MLGHGDRLLAGGGVGDEQGFLRLEEGVQALELLDEFFVDFLSAGGASFATFRTSFSVWSGV
jgi:hypothetical protein